MKINIVIADTDSNYIDSFTKFISYKYSKKIDLVSFTKLDALLDYVDKATSKVDILLLNREFLSNTQTNFKDIGVVILLSDGVVTSDDNVNYVIQKYQAVDNIIDQITEIFSKEFETLSLLSENEYSRLICVYSPIGGIGKTSISLALSAKLAELGKKVMLISLEGIGSFFAPLSGKGTCALTNLMLGLLDHSESIVNKVELNKTFDKTYGIHFLEPPECFKEITDANKNEIETLFTQLKKFSTYDYIIVDMESKADSTIFPIFELSNSIIFLTSQEPLSCYKTSQFIKQITKLNANDEFEMTDKIVPVANKYTNGSIVNESFEHFKNKEYAIPFFRNLWKYEDGLFIFDPSKSMRNALLPLAEGLGGIN